MTKRTTIYISEKSRAVIGNPESTSGRITVICDRYGEILRRQRVADKFSAAEMTALRQLNNGFVAEPAAMLSQCMATRAEDAIRYDNLAAEYGCDGAGMVEKLRGLTYAEEVALIEEIEAWWQSQSPNVPAGEGGQE